jgi:hypothetical protein
LTRIRLLRNRIDHLAPIVFDPNLRQIHQLISEITGWMSPAAELVASRWDDTIRLYGETWRPIRAELDTQAGLP